MGRPSNQKLLKRRVGRLGGRKKNCILKRISETTEEATEKFDKAITKSVSSNKAGGKKPPCRQTLWRQRKRAEAAKEMENKIEQEIDSESSEASRVSPGGETREVQEPEEGVNGDLVEAIESIASDPKSTMEEEVTKGLQNWPPISDLRRELKRKKTEIVDHDQVRYYHVLEFMRLQRLGLQKPFWKRPRKELAALVAATAEKGYRVAFRIIHLEWQWIQKNTIIPHKQGRFSSIRSLLQDESTLIAIREYIAGAGTNLGTQGLANAVTAYRRSGRLDFGDDDLWEVPEREICDLPPPTLTANTVEKIISQRTASTWLRSLGYKYHEVRKGIYKDGHERPDFNGRKTQKSNFKSTIQIQRC
ncbi:hypothetical protein HOY82DRAFT_599720 [Tuber indicum]|nr:hypothetical protein HOY82DRAFT_599720 [Tuber indicum]